MLGRFLRKIFGSNKADASISEKSGAKARETSAVRLVASDPRRYKRAMLLVGGGSIQNELASASAHYRGHDFQVADLSHAGIAIVREESGEGVIPDRELPDPEKTESIVLNLGLLQPIPVQVKIVRHSDRVLAFELVNVSTDARLAIDRFLDPKMIGLNMRAVDRAFFSPGETFSSWFCGPRDTNFFLWMSGSRLERSIIQLGDEQFTLTPAGESGVRFVRHNAPSRGKASDLRASVLFALDVALQIQGGGSAIAGLVKLLTEAADTLPISSDGSGSGTGF